MESAEVSSWQSFALNKQLLRAIEDLEFEHPTAIQARCIPAVLGGQQVIGIAQTGTGKTAAYLLPLLMKVRYAQGQVPRALILAPTKELVVQLADQARQLAAYTDIRVSALFGGVGPKQQVESIGQGVDLLVSTPGRFLELYQKGIIEVKQIKTLVIDEADRMLDMGFWSQLKRIFEVIPPKRQNLLFSATFSPKVEKLAEEFITFPFKIEVTPQASISTLIDQHLYLVPNLKTKINLLVYLLNQESYSRVMIFTRSKQTADNVFHFLERRSLGPAKVIHSNKGQNTRINAMNAFKQGEIRILVSTEVAARGIDVTNVSHVINFDVPVLYEDYVHRIGRTGRASQTGTAITFCTRPEEYHIRKIEKLIRKKIPVSEIPGSVKVEETPFEESQLMAREMDTQRKKDDPTFKGGFHEKKNK